ncbi:ANTAR domain-containing response regulator [Rhizobium sp. AAP43]|uniref:ANTAR domain-containing response regulator n=1 Tax=Rhizobium sp. AAP43 TaxID=1523420 RepID=UPI0006B88416|nr:ANTAR domain-containing protein [Rhizobium sp. AAP43]KPF41333.1 transcriptional regulator [Rhizobium sp. AAP43]
MTATPNFNGWRAAVLSEEDGNVERLKRQLVLLGMQVDVQWEPLAPTELPEIIIVDADRGWDALLPWSIEAPQRPVAALLGSEAPGRIAWAIRHGASAIIPKPVASATVFPALVLAVSIHTERLAVQAKIAHLEERLRLRPVVFAAIARLQSERKVTEEQAFAALRSTAMKRRLPMEQIAAAFLGGVDPLWEVG